MKMILDAAAVHDLRNRLAQLEVRLDQLAAAVVQARHEMTVVAALLDDGARERKRQVAKPVQLAARVIELVGAQTGVDAPAIYGRDRTGRVAWVRQLAIYVMHRLGMSSTQIGLVLGRDHSTCVHAIQHVRRARKQRAGLHVETERMVMAAMAMLADSTLANGHASEYDSRDGGRLDSAGDGPDGRPGAGGGVEFGAASGNS
jgi:chromosomal replication initiation ATPase DnaA